MILQPEDRIDETESVRYEEVKAPARIAYYTREARATVGGRKKTGTLKENLEKERPGSTHLGTWSGGDGMCLGDSGTTKCGVVRRNIILLVCCRNTRYLKPLHCNVALDTSQSASHMIRCLPYDNALHEAHHHLLITKTRSQQQAVVLHALGHETPTM